MEVVIKKYIMEQFRLKILVESRIRWKVYVRFGGEYLETYHSNMTRRWVLSLRLYTDLDAETKENFVLWDMQGSFKATHYLSFYVRGENLLAQRYEIIAGYPMPKATFMGGVNINF